MHQRASLRHPAGPRSCRSAAQRNGEASQLNATALPPDLHWDASLGQPGPRPSFRQRYAGEKYWALRLAAEIRLPAGRLRGALTRQIFDEEVIASTNIRTEFKDADFACFGPLVDQVFGEVLT